MPNGKRNIILVANRTLYAVLENQPAPGQQPTGKFKVEPPGAGGLVTAITPMMELGAQEDPNKKSQILRVVGWPGKSYGDNPTAMAEVTRILDGYKTTPVHPHPNAWKEHYTHSANGVDWLLYHADSRTMAKAFENQIGWIDGEEGTLENFAKEYETVKEQKKDFKTFWPKREDAMRSFKVSREVVAQFVQTTIEEVIKNLDKDPIVWVHDYQLKSFCTLFRERVQSEERLAGKYIPMGFFCHIPFPRFDRLKKALNQQYDRDNLRDMLLGPLGADQIGFHIPRYCTNYLQSLDHFNESLQLGITKIDVELGMVEYKGRIISVKNFPIGIDYATYTSPAEAAHRQMDISNRSELQPEHQALITEFEKFHHDAIVFISPEREDPIKGILKKLEAFEKLLNDNPHLIGRISYECIAASTRSGVRSNDELDVAVIKLKDKINSNRRFITDKFPNGPVHFVDKARELPVLREFYRRSHVGMMASYIDGQNLTAIEFVAAQPWGAGGILVLGPKMGITEHFRINEVENHFFTADPEGSVEAYAAVLKDAADHCLDLEKKQKSATSMQALKEIVVSKCNVKTWADNISDEIVVMGARNANPVVPIEQLGQATFAAIDTSPDNHNNNNNNNNNHNDLMSPSSSSYYSNSGSSNSSPFSSNSNNEAARSNETVQRRLELFSTSFVGPNNRYERQTPPIPITRQPSQVVPPQAVPIKTEQTTEKSNADALSMSM